MKKTLLAILFSFLSIPAFAVGLERHSTEAEQLDPMFERAGEEFGVPSDLLRSIAFVESRWTNHVPFVEEGGVPASYGVMGLRDDDWFGHSLRDAAAMIGRTPDELKHDPELNIRRRRRTPRHPRTRREVARGLGRCSGETERHPAG